MNERDEELLAEFLERLERGEPVDPDAFCAQHADSSPGLRAALAALARTEALFPTGAAPAAEERVGPWRVLGRLGRGGMGDVLRVVGAEDGAGPFALKLLRLEIASQAHARERLAREASILARLEHPGIVRVHSLELDHTPAYLVMELIEGPSLAQLVRSARRDDTPLALPGDAPAWRRAAQLIVELARAVAAAHAAGLLHRDLKPSNVLLRPDGRPALIDFGLAVHEDSATLTETGALLGTPHYMAPEQARGERAEATADVYGLAAILFELLTRRPPQLGEEPLEVLEAVRNRPVPRVRSLAPEIPPALGRVVDRALHWQPKRRHASVDELRADLESVLHGDAPRARRPGPLQWVGDQLHFYPRRCGAALIGLLAAGLLVALVTRPTSDPGVLEERTRAALRSASEAWIDRRFEDAPDLTELVRDWQPAGRLAGAQSWLRTVAGFERPDEPSELEQHLERGSDALEARDNALALKEFERASALAPNWSIPIYLAGTAARRNGDLERGTVELLAAARLAPGALQIVIDLARVQRKLEDYAGALAELERALPIGRDSWIYWGDLSRARLELGDYEGGLAAVEESLARAPADRRRVLRSRQAAALDHLDRREEARAALLLSIADEPEDPTARYNLGYSLDLDCRLAEAREAYRGALERDPDSVQTLMALSHIAAGSDRESCTTCEDEFSVQPDLFDPQASLEYTLHMLSVDRGRSQGVVDYAVQVAKRLDQVQPIRAKLAELVTGREIDARIVRLERALRALSEQ